MLGEVQCLRWPRGGRAGSVPDSRALAPRRKAKQGLVDKPSRPRMLEPAAYPQMSSTSAAPYVPTDGIRLLRGEGEPEVEWRLWEALTGVGSTSCEHPPARGLSPDRAPQQ